MLTAIGLVLATALLVFVVIRVRQVLTWLVIAAFIAVAVYPLVDWLQRRLLGGRRRALATLVVFLAIALVLVALVVVFAAPLVSEATRVARRLPEFVAEARAGRGPVGNLLERTHALEWVQNNQNRIDEFARGLTAPVAGLLSGVASVFAGTATVLVLAYLLVLEGPKLVTGTMALVPPGQAERIRRVGADCARSVTGYVSGNLLISVICGSLTYVVLRTMGVPFAALIALFVGVTDLIPLVGATIGGAVAVLAGFIHSVPAGIVVLVFFVLYQLLENHVLQPLVFARTVQLSPLTVIVAILVAAQLAGILGALLAIPVASIIQVLLRDIWDHRAGRPKTQPTVGEDRRPVPTE